MTTTKVALVTGASSGIGEATARELASAGLIVYAAARRTERMRELTTLGIHPIALDVTDDASMQQVVDTIIGEQGRLDVLVNNAGYGSYGALEDVPMEEARAQMEVNVFGAARLIQLVLPHMRSRRAGTIVNVTSMGGRITTPLGAWYHATPVTARWSSAPELIAQTIRKAVTARRPRTRYAVGFGAKPMIAMHTLLPDRAYDAMMRRITGVPTL